MNILYGIDMLLKIRPQVRSSLISVLVLAMIARGGASSPDT